MSTMLTNLLTAVSNALITESRVKPSVWGDGDYGTCYAKSDLIPKQVATVLKRPILANQSSDQIKEEITKKVTAYQEAGWFNQFLLRWREPIDAYQRFYTINRLYELQAQLTKAKDKIKEYEEKGDSPEFALEKLLLPILFGYQSSHIPAYLKAGFFNGYKIFNLHQQMNQRFRSLQHVLDDRYHALLAAVLTSEDEKIEEHEAKIKVFFEEIAVQRKALRSQYQQHQCYLDFFGDFEKKKALLEEIIRLRKQKEAVPELKTADQAVISQVAKRWNRSLAYLTTDCRIRIGRGRDAIENTYVLEKSFWGSWSLSYYGLKKSKAQSIAIGTIPGLADALQKNDRKKIRETLSSWHQAHGVHIHTMNPVQKHQALVRLSSRDAARAMIANHPLVATTILRSPSFSHSLTDYAKKLIAFGKGILGWKTNYDTKEYNPLLAKISNETQVWEQALKALKQKQAQLQEEAVKNLVAAPEKEMIKRWDEVIASIAVDGLSPLAKRQFEQAIAKEKSDFEAWLEKCKNMSVNVENLLPSSYKNEITDAFDAIEITKAMIEAADPEAVLRTLTDSKASELLLKYMKVEADIENLKSIYQEISHGIRTCFTRLNEQSQRQTVHIPSPKTATTSTTSASVTSTTTNFTAMPITDEPNVWENWLTQLKYASPRSELATTFHTAFTTLSQHNQKTADTLRDSIETMLSSPNDTNKAAYEKYKAIAITRFDYLLKLRICLIELAKHGYFKEKRQEIEEEIRDGVKAIYSMYIFILHPDKWTKQPFKLEGSGFDGIKTLYQNEYVEIEKTIQASHYPDWLQAPAAATTQTEKIMQSFQNYVETYMKESKQMWEDYIREEREAREAHIKEQKKIIDDHIKEDEKITNAYIQKQDKRLDAFIEEERKDLAVLEANQARQEQEIEQLSEGRKNFEVSMNCIYKTAIQKEREAIDTHCEKTDQLFEDFFEEERKKEDEFNQRRREKEEEDKKFLDKSTEMLAELYAGIAALKADQETIVADPIPEVGVTIDPIHPSSSFMIFKPSDNADSSNTKSPPATTPASTLGHSPSGTNNG